MRYRKKPVEVDAWLFDRTAAGHALEEMGVGKHVEPTETTPEIMCIQTLEGVMTARLGDYIIRGVKGEFYPCKPDIFEASYEPAE